MPILLCFSVWLLFHTVLLVGVLVKRIVAVGGDTVSLNDQDGSFAVNQELATATRILTVPKDYFFVVGDNRQNSFDSRFWEEPFVGAKWVLARVKS